MDFYSGDAFLVTLPAVVGLGQFGVHQGIQGSEDRVKNEMVYLIILDNQIVLHPLKRMS